MGERPIRIPSTLPANLVEPWLNELTSAAAQGCGHIRYGMKQPTEYGLADNGAVLRNLLRVFYKAFWAIPAESPRKHKFSIQVKMGDLAGRAILIVNNTGSVCRELAPAVIPNSRAASVFVYNGDAVATWRRRVVGPFFKRFDPSLNEQEFVRSYQRLGDRQLGATLRLLPGANNVPLFKVDVTAVRVPAPTAAPSTSAPTTRRVRRRKF
eukprot:TRINITY_DN2999_c0_g2_i2.p1 TRINITY_DN2999_c0_g2~~TRINITY_DN2999_c0_g2_i2.p1  ORF type:complete len:229 (+),score=102.40 TRINITY_DN2999_c0_g2_i2:59-688(+)